MGRIFGFLFIFVFSMKIHPVSEKIKKRENRRVDHLIVHLRWFTWGICDQLGRKHQVSPSNLKSETMNFWALVKEKLRKKNNKNLH